MKCPLSITGRLNRQEKFIGAAADCLKEECAWYDNIIQQCLIYALHTDLAYLGSLLKKEVRNDNRNE